RLLPSPRRQCDVKYRGDETGIHARQSQMGGSQPAEQESPAAGNLFGHVPEACGAGGRRAGVNFAYSVVIPACNAAPTIAATIGSLLVQGVPAQEIFVVNDGSTDGTARIAASCAANVIVLEQPNLGPGAATTAGFRRVAAPFVATLDADDLWLPHKI